MNQPEPLWNSLEIVKLLVDILTPLLLLLLGLWVNRISKRIDTAQWANQKVVEKRLAVFDETAPDLNDLLCFFTYVGNWKELTPLDIVQLKRRLDKTIYVNAPLFSNEFFTSYFHFIHLCFRTHTGMGEDAKLRTSAADRETTATGQWDKSWNRMFTNEDVSDKLQSAYKELMSVFANEIGIGL